MRPRVVTLSSVDTYVVRSYHQEPGAYLCLDPKSGLWLPDFELAQEEDRIPAVLSQTELIQVLALIQVSRYSYLAWSWEPAPEPCPACESPALPNRKEFCQPIGPRSNRWRASCEQCGFQAASARLKSGAIVRWNMYPSGCRRPGDARAEQSAET